MRLIFMSLLTIICSLFSCTAQTDKYKSVEVEEFEKTIADTSVVRLDVRTPEEYVEGHIAGALNIDVQNDSFEQKATTRFTIDKHSYLTILHYESTTISNCVLALDNCFGISLIKM